MLTLENTSGFDQATLDKMNAEVQAHIQHEINNLLEPDIFDDTDYEIFEEYWDKVVLEKYGGLRK